MTDVTDTNIAVTVEIEGRSAVQGSMAAELLYEFKYDNDLAILTNFDGNNVTAEFAIHRGRYEDVVRFITRLKAHGLLVQSDVRPA